MIVDGSKFEIPNTSKAREWANIKDDNIVYTKPARVLFSTIIDEKYGIVLDSILGESDSNEREMLKKHIENLKNTILIMDRGYYSLELKLFLEKHKINYIFRLSSQVYEKEINNMNESGEILKIKYTSIRQKSIKDEDLLKRV